MMRPFTLDEERALLSLLAGGACWHPVPKKAGPLVWNKLTALGCVQQLQDGPVTKARLTRTGRYYARLLAGVREPAPVEAGPGPWTKAAVALIAHGG